MATKRCPHCNAPLQPWTDECRHRRACEARQMLAAGAPVEDVAAHAQRLPRSQGQIVSDMEMDRQAARDGYNPNR